MERFQEDDGDISGLMGRPGLSLDHFTQKKQHQSQQRQLGSSVYLDLVDDYVAPSQACVNPIFTQPEQPKEEEPVGVIVPRQRKKQRGGATAVAAPRQKVTASIADCLACSGCVTTAETVLLEQQHSLVKLREILQTRRVVLSISPAAWADLDRHILGDTKEDKRRQWVTILHRYLNIVGILDGNVTRQWTLQASVQEFLAAYRQSRDDDMDIEEPEEEHLERQLTASAAIDAWRTQYWFKDGTTKNLSKDKSPGIRTKQQLPLISASCPAIVCYVEKSFHEGVPHLSTIASPMTTAALFWGGLADVFHLAVQPCHDKKLEASRKDFDGLSTTDMVVTTSEFLQLLLESFESDGNLMGDGQGPEKRLQSMIMTATPAKTVVVSNPALCRPVRIDEPTLFVATSSTQYTNEPTGEAAFFPFGSGGYADYLFRATAFQEFGLQIPSTTSVWYPIRTKSLSARRNRRRDFYQATIHRVGDAFVLGSAETTGDSVLRFGIAYGMQTLQRALDDKDAFDYIEAMACPGSCLNGGGQLRVTERENPSETRQRCAETRRHFYYDPQPKDFGEALYTRYHVVPPMQHTLGAAAGVAVSDTQW